MTHRTLTCFLPILAATFFIGGCQSFLLPQPLATDSTSFPTAAEYKTLFHDPIVPSAYELPSGALATWREFAGGKPTLVLFAAHPLLSPLDDDQLPTMLTLLREGSAAEIVRRGQSRVADPLIRSDQAVSLAMAAGFFSEVIIVQPSTVELDKFTLAAFQQKALAAGFLTEREADGLSQQGGVIGGTLRGLPFRYVHPLALPKLDRTAIVHIDLGFFNDLFVNPIKTPAYQLLFQTAALIREAKVPTVAVTLSYSTLEEAASLDARFMIGHLAEVVRHPDYIQRGAPASWSLRSEAFFSQAMFAEGRYEELVAQAAAVEPADAAATYEWSLLLLRQMRNIEGFAALDRAVALDRGYALAYLDLAESGTRTGNLEQATTLLDKAAAAFPDNPFIRISQADLLIRRNHSKEAIPLLWELQRLPWSSTKHPGITELLAEMQDVAREQAAKAP